MKIKLKARLSAYGKISNLSDLSKLPDPAQGVAGDVLGVDENGNYSFFPVVESSKIEALFSDVSEQE